MSPASGPAVPKRVRILVVENSPADAELLIHELESDGYEVAGTCVETADAMRAALETDTWDVVISDYSLPKFSAPEALMVLRRTAATFRSSSCPERSAKRPPSGMDGGQLARHLTPGWPNLRVIFMSGYADPSVEEALPDGCDLMEKPFTAHTLLSRVRESLGSRVVTRAS